MIPYNLSRSKLNLYSLLNSPQKAEKVTIGITSPEIILIIITKLGLRENQHPDQPCSQPLRGLLPPPGLRPESPMASRALPGPGTPSLQAFALLCIFQWHLRIILYLRAFAHGIPSAWRCFPTPLSS